MQALNHVFDLTKMVLLGIFTSHVHFLARVFYPL